MSVTQLYNAIFLIFFMGGPEGTNLLEHFDAEIDWTGVPITREYDRVQREYAHPARQDPFSGFSYYEDRPAAKPKAAPKKRKRKMGKIKRMIEDIKYVNDLLGTTESTMTKDMIIGPHRKKRLGNSKFVNVGSQLKQMVDDTKILKQQFKVKIQSQNGLRQWAQIVCRHRQTPGVGETTVTPHGVVLDPDSIGLIPPSPNTYDNYYDTLPPVPRGSLTEPSSNPIYGPYEIVTTSSGPGTSNLFFLNMPLTYLEQDMFNMGIGPGMRDYTYQMGQGRGQPASLTTQQQNVPTTGDSMTNTNSETETLDMAQNYDTGPYYGMDRTRLTQMMRAVHPQPAQLTIRNTGKQVIGKFTDEFTYNFRRGWGIHLLDYNPVANDNSTTAGKKTAEQTAPNDPQYLRTNNSMNTIATIKNGSITYSMNNMGESQCYVTTLVVVNKHVDELYYSMPEALTDTYLKCAQNFIQSGEWSISNNITNAMKARGGLESKGDDMNAYMYVTHPSIKPFGKVPTRFLEEFNRHFTIKMSTTTKLGIGERQSCTYNLGGLQYSTEQLAMKIDQVVGEGVALPNDYKPVDYTANSLAKQKARFPLCCQQGTTHLLFGVQGMSLPFLSNATEASTVQGRWAVPALVDIQGTYKEVIAPLSTKPKKATPIQKCLTALPSNTWSPVVTTLPRVRTETTGLMPIGFT